MSKASEIIVCTATTTDTQPIFAPIPGAPAHKTLLDAKRWLKDNAQPGNTYTFVRIYPDRIAVRQITQLEMFTPEQTGER